MDAAEAEQFHLLCDKCDHKGKPRLEIRPLLVNSAVAYCRNCNKYIKVVNFSESRKRKYEEAKVPIGVDSQHRLEEPREEKVLVKSVGLIKGEKQCRVTLLPLESEDENEYRIEMATKKWRGTDYQVGNILIMRWEKVVPYTGVAFRPEIVKKCCKETIQLSPDLPLRVPLHAIHFGPDTLTVRLRAENKEDAPYLDEIKPVVQAQTIGGKQGGTLTRVEIRLGMPAWTEAHGSDAVLNADLDQLRRFIIKQGDSVAFALVGTLEATYDDPNNWHTTLLSSDEADAGGKPSSGLRIVDSKMNSFRKIKVDEETRRKWEEIKQQIAALFESKGSVDAESVGKLGERHHLSEEDMRKLMNDWPFMMMPWPKEYNKLYYDHLAEICERCVFYGSTKETEGFLFEYPSREAEPDAKKRLVIWETPQHGKATFVLERTPVAQAWQLIQSLKRTELQMSDGFRRRVIHNDLTSWKQILHDCLYQ